MAVEVTVIPDFWDDKSHYPRVPPGDDQPLTEETMDSGYVIVFLYNVGTWIYFLSDVFHVISIMIA